MNKHEEKNSDTKYTTTYFGACYPKGTVFKSAGKEVYAFYPNGTWDFWGIHLSSEIAAEDARLLNEDQN